MKSTNRYAVIVASLLVAALAALSGCATTGLQRSEKTGVSMKNVEQDIRNATAQVDVTGQALQELVRPGQADLKKAFKTYASEVDRMEHLGKVLFEHADKMNAQGKNYFEEWQKQGDAYANPEIQNLSEQRRLEMSAVYVRISEASVGVKRAAKDYLSNIKEIRTYLSNDLTPKGIDAIAPVAGRSVNAGDDLKASVVPVLNAIDAARTELSHGAAK